MVYGGIESLALQGPTQALKGDGGPFALQQHLRGEYNLHRLKIFLPDDELQVLSNAANMPFRLMSSISVAVSFLVLDAPDDGDGEHQYFWTQCQLHIDNMLATIATTERLATTPVPC